MPTITGSESFRGFNCGGNWNNGANAGVFYANGNNSFFSNRNDNIGFRSALPHSQILQTQGSALSARVSKGIHSLGTSGPKNIRSPIRAS